MAWDTRQIEKKLEERLKRGDVFSESEGIDHFANYVTARRKLVEEILPSISAIENSLTDHGERHIANVLDNIYKLLGDDLDRITVTEHYFLCLIALFHDVGNIHGRTGHYDKSVIYKIYGYVKGNDPVFDDEKNLVAEVASKHSGKASDGTSDTIKELSADEQGLWNQGIDLRKCAAILRLADELAEGIQRTSNFMILNHKYDPATNIHHEYARCTTVFISRKDNRIALTYRIKIDSNIAGIWDQTKQLIEYIYKRILKLNNERLYNKYYAEILSDFKKVEATLNFEVDGTPVSIGIKQLVFTDLIMPSEENIKEITKNDTSYLIDTIIEQLKKNITSGATA